MDIADVTAQGSVEQAIADQTLRNRDPVPAGWSAGELPGKPSHAHEILSAIISHRAVPSTLQMVADAFVSLCPSKGVAIFLFSGRRFQIEAEAGLPNRLPGTLPPHPGCSSVDAHSGFSIAGIRSFELPVPDADPGLRGYALSGIAADLRFRRTARSLHGIRPAAGPSGPNDSGNNPKPMRSRPDGHRTWSAL